MTLAFRFTQRDKPWIDKQLRLLDDPKKTADPVSIDPGVLGVAVCLAGVLATTAVGVEYRKMSCPPSVLLERYGQVSECVVCVAFTCHN